MADTNYTAYVTRVLNAWLQDLNDGYYRANSTITGYVLGYKRTQPARNADRISVKDLGATGDGVVATDTTFVRAALAANPGRTVHVPSGVYNGTSRLLIGGPAQTAYHSLEGEGPAIYSNNTPTTPRSILNFTTGNGVLIDSQYQRTRNLAVVGTAAGGSDPTTLVVADLKRMGFALSGGAFHGGYSHHSAIDVSGFDTGFTDAGGFVAYLEMENCSVFSCVNGWAWIGAITDLHIRGGVTVDCSQYGWFQAGASRITLSDHLFETSGSASPNLAQVAVRLEDEAQLRMIACGLQDNTCYFVNRYARLELIACNPITDNKFFGSGEFIFNDSLGKAIDIPVPAPNTWTLTNVTCAATSNVSYPACYHVQSTSNAASIQMLIDIPISDWAAGIDKLAVTKGASDDVKHYVHVQWEGVFPGGFHTPPSTWSAAAGFNPGVSVFCFGAGGQDNFEVAVDSQAIAFTFVADYWERINMIFPLTWSAAALNGTIEKLRILIQFSGGAVDYTVNNLDYYMTKPKAVFYQRNVST